MPRKTITMPGYQGNPWTVTGTVQDGLILHKMGLTWMITHIGTGRHVGKGWKVRKPAKAAMAVLLGLGYNWTLETLEEMCLDKGQTEAEMGQAVMESGVYYKDEF